MAATGTNRLSGRVPPVPRPLPFTKNGYARKARKPAYVLGLTLLLALQALSAAGYAATATVTDMAGRSLRVPAEIKKVVPLGAAARYLVYLQSLDLVAGMEAIETKPATAGRPYSLVSAERAQQLPVIGEGGPGRLPDFEKIIAVWPDVILAMGMDPAQVENIQQKTGIPVFVLSYGASGTIDMATVKQAIETLGHLLQRDERARRLIAYLEAMENDLASRTAAIANSDRSRSYVGAVSYMGLQPITSTEAHFLPLAWAGGRNVAGEIGRAGHCFIDPEQLLVWNPADIFIDAAGLGKVAEGYRRDPAYFQRLEAVKNGRVFLIMPFNNYHSNIEIALADAWFIGKSLYPEHFADIDPAGKADEIFSFFLGIPAYAALKQEFRGFGRIGFGSDGPVVY